MTADVKSRTLADRSSGLRVSQQPDGRIALGAPARRRRRQRAARPHRSRSGVRCHAADHGAADDRGRDPGRELVRPQSAMADRRDWSLAPAAGSARHRRGRSAAEDAVEATQAADFTPALVHCARIFGLSPFERELLLLVAGLELDEGLRLAVAAASDGASAQASFGLSLTLLTQPHSDALSSDGPLRHWRMVEPEPVANLARAALRIDERILHYLTGIVASDSVLAGVASPLSVQPNSDETDPAMVERIARALHLIGPLRTGRRAARSRSRPGRPPRPGACRVGAARPACALAGSARSAGECRIVAAAGNACRPRNRSDRVRAGGLVGRSRHGTGCARAGFASAQRRAVAGHTGAAASRAAARPPGAALRPRGPRCAAHSPGATQSLAAPHAGRFIRG